MAIRKYVGLYYAMKNERGVIDPFMVPFRDFVKEQIKLNNVDIDSLLKYMIDNDESNCALFLATTMFMPKKGLSSLGFYSKIAEDKILTPYVDEVDMDAFALVVVAFVFDNFRPNRMDISEIVAGEIFNYPTNQYGLTKVNGAVFKVDGLIIQVQNSGILRLRHCRILKFVLNLWLPHFCMLCITLKEMFLRILTIQKINIVVMNIYKNMQIV